MIELRSVVKRYGAFAAVENLSIEIASHEMCVLVGPSGCGKTTTLKMINRLIEPTSGSILIDDVDVLALDPVELRRGIGYVMQQGGLFPHRRVADNVATIPRLLGWPAARVAARVDELLELVGLDPATYRRRFPHELSGGERQRVGVARALGADPPILLMDEPFGAVDPIVRKRLQLEFLELQARLGKTVVFVTHDIDEALLLGHRIAIMQRGGVIEQLDTPAMVLSRPATPFVAEFVGSDRDIRRLGVTEVTERDLIGLPTVAPEATGGEMATLARQAGVERLAVVDGGSALGFVDLPCSGGPAAGEMRPFAGVIPLGTSLKTILVAMLDDDDPVVAVTGEGGRFLGIVTLESLHAVVRRSAKEPAPTR